MTNIKNQFDAVRNVIETAIHPISTEAIVEAVNAMSESTGIKIGGATPGKTCEKHLNAMKDVERNADKKWLLKGSKPKATREPTPEPDADEKAVWNADAEDAVNKALGKVADRFVAEIKEGKLKSAKFVLIPEKDDTRIYLDVYKQMSLVGTVKGNPDWLTTLVEDFNAGFETAKSEYDAKFESAIEKQSKGAQQAKEMLDAKKKEQADSETKSKDSIGDADDISKALDEMHDDAFKYALTNPNLTEVAIEIKAMSDDNGDGIGVTSKWTDENGDDENFSCYARLSTEIPEDLMESLDAGLKIMNMSLERVIELRDSFVKIVEPADRAPADPDLDPEQLAQIKWLVNENPDLFEEALQKCDERRAEQEARQQEIDELKETIRKAQERLDELENQE